MNTSTNRSPTVRLATARETITAVGLELATVNRPELHDVLCDLERIDDLLGVVGRRLTVAAAAERERSQRQAAGYLAHRLRGEVLS